VQQNLAGQLTMRWNPRGELTEKDTMKVFTGTVKGGLVKLPSRARLRDGSRVVMAVLPDAEAAPDDARVAELEAEDVEFVRACRGRLTKHLHDEDA